MFQESQVRPKKARSSTSKAASTTLKSRSQNQGHSRNGQNHVRNHGKNQTGRNHTAQQNQARHQQGTKQPNFKISPVTLAVKGSQHGHRKQELKAQAKYVLPLLPRMDVSSSIPSKDVPREILSLVQSCPDSLNSSPINPSSITTYRLAPQVTSSSSSSPPNLLFLEPIPASQLGGGGEPQELKSAPLPSMDTLKRNNATSNSSEPCQLYVILETGEMEEGTATTTTLYAEQQDMLRPRRDSGSSSTGQFSFRSLSASPCSSNISCSSGDLELDTSLDSMETGLQTVAESMDIDMDTMQVVDTVHHTMDSIKQPLMMEKCADIPNSPTELEPTIDQLFRRPDITRIEAMEQFIILEDIHQIIGEAS